MLRPRSETSTPMSIILRQTRCMFPVPKPVVLTLVRIVPSLCVQTYEFLVYPPLNNFCSNHNFQPEDDEEEDPLYEMMLQKYEQQQTPKKPIAVNIVNVMPNNKQIIEEQPQPTTEPIIESSAKKRKRETDDLPSEEPEENKPNKRRRKEVCLLNDCFEPPLILGFRLSQVLPLKNHHQDKQQPKNQLQENSPVKSHPIFIK